MFSVRIKIIMRVKLTSTLLRQGACVRGGVIISVFVQRLRSKTWTYLQVNVFFLFFIQFCELSIVWFLAVLLAYCLFRTGRQECRW